MDTTKISDAAKSLARAEKKLEKLTVGRDAAIAEATTKATASAHKKYDAKVAAATTVVTDGKTALAALIQN